MFVVDDNVFRLDDLFGLYYLNVQQISSDCEVEDLEIIDFRGFVDSLDLIQSDAYVESYRPRYQCNGRIHKCFKGGKRKFCEAVSHFYLLLIIMIILSKKSM